MGNVINQLAFPAPDPRYSKPYLVEREDLVVFPIRTGEKIFAVDLQQDPSATGPRAGGISSTTGSPYPRPYYILYSHGNAEDVGLALPYLEELMRMTGCSVFAYEYSGYSLTEGQPYAWCS